MRSYRNLDFKGTLSIGTTALQCWKLRVHMVATGWYNYNWAWTSHVLNSMMRSSLDDYLWESPLYRSIPLAILCQNFATRCAPCVLDQNLAGSLHRFQGLRSSLTLIAARCLDGEHPSTGIAFSFYEMLVIVRTSTSSNCFGRPPEVQPAADRDAACRSNYYPYPTLLCFRIIHSSSIMSLQILVLRLRKFSGNRFFELVQKCVPRWGLTQRKRFGVLGAVHVNVASLSRRKRIRSVKIIWVLWW